MISEALKAARVTRPTNALLTALCTSHWCHLFFSNFTSSVHLPLTVICQLSDQTYLVIQDFPAAFNGVCILHESPQLQFNPFYLGRCTNAYYTHKLNATFRTSFLKFKVKLKLWFFLQCGSYFRTFGHHSYCAVTLFRL